MFDDIKLSRPDLAIDPVHDNRHALDDVPFARESIPYIVVLPEEGIKAFIYTWVNKESEAGAALAIFGPGVGDEPIQQRLPDRKVPEDMDFSNWQIDSFSLRQDLEFKHADIRWEPTMLCWSSATMPFIRLMPTAHIKTVARHL